METTTEGYDNDYWHAAYSALRESLIDLFDTDDVQAIRRAFDKGMVALTELDRQRTANPIEHLFFDDSPEQEHDRNREDIATLLEYMLAEGTRCPLCGANYAHRHTGLEILCYHNGIKWARASQQAFREAREVG